MAADKLEVPGVDHKVFLSITVSSRTSEYIDKPEVRGVDHEVLLAITVSSLTSELSNGRDI